MPGRVAKTYSYDYGRHPASIPRSVSAQADGHGTLGCLKAELRNMVYDRALPLGEIYYVHGKIFAGCGPKATQLRLPGLLLASKTLRGEAHSYFSSGNTFIIRIGNPVSPTDRPITQTVHWIRNMIAHSNGYNKLTGLHICPPTGFWAYLPQYFELLHLALDHKIPFEIMKRDQNSFAWPTPGQKFTIMKGEYKLVTEFLQKALDMLKTARQQKWSVTTFSSAYNGIQATLSSRPSKPKPIAGMQQRAVQVKVPWPERVIFSGTTLFKGADFLLYETEGDAHESLRAKALRTTDAPAWKKCLPSLLRIHTLLSDTLPLLQAQRQALANTANQACINLDITSNQFSAFEDAYARFISNDEQIRFVQAYLRANVAATSAVPAHASLKLDERKHLLTELAEIDGFWNEGELIALEAADVDRAVTLNSELSKVQEELNIMGVLF